MHRTFRMSGVGQVDGSQGRKGTPEKFASEPRALGRYSMLSKWKCIQQADPVEDMVRDGLKEKS